MTLRTRVLTIVALLALAGCVTVPSGPTVRVLPGTGKSFDQFRADDFDCRHYARDQVGGVSPSEAAADSGVRSAALGTVLGAAAGAAIDGRSGAATGAGVGLLMGALAGTGAGQGSAYAIQRRYDAGYEQCMYAKGHRVPVAAGYPAYSSGPHYPPRYYYPPPPRPY